MFDIIVSLAFLMYFSKINNYGKSRIIIYTCDNFNNTTLISLL